MIKDRLNICIFHTNKNAFSETFIRNHINFLPANVFDLYGGWFPAFDKNDRRIADHFIKRSFGSKLLVVSCKLLPAFISNRIPSGIKGYPYDEVLNEHAFKFYLKHHKIDVVLAEFMYQGLWIKDICSGLGIPLVVHTHGGGDIMNIEYLNNYSKLFPDYFKKVAKMISVDSFSSSKLLELGLQKTKLTEIGYGVDLNLFTPAKPSLNDPIFFAVGRFANKKAPYLTILAFSSVLKKHPNAKLIIAGNGDLFDCCNQIVKALKIENNVSFPGVLSPIKVSEYMQKSRAFVQHSIHTSEGDSEGTPVAILEAMACGLPVISTYHNGISDVVKHEEEGLLVDENDIDAMTICMIRVLENPYYADQLGQNGRKKIEEHFEMSKVIEDLYSILEEVVSKHDYFLVKA